MSNKPGTIIVAEDDKSVRHVVQQALLRQGYAVQSSGNAAGLWRLIESGKGDVLITDVALPDGDALDLLSKLKEYRPELPVIVMSARSTLLTAVKAQRIGVFEYLPKPFELGDLIEVTKRAVETIETTTKSLQTNSQMVDGNLLIGRSRPMQDIFKAMARVVSTDHTILITGESGTGKEIVAKELHHLGHRKNRPFIPINFSIIPEQSAEVELFGKVENGEKKYLSFKGRLGEAEGGTLFLDEIGDMSLDTQGKLLGVLKEGKYFPVGEQNPVYTNFRVIAATNQNLHHLMHQGLFREDLFYHLNVVPLRLPPLRDRVEDIGPLVSHFIFKENKGEPDQKTITSDALRALKRWHWPGNVRELENLVQRLLVLDTKNEIGAKIVEREIKNNQPEILEEAESLSGSVDTHIRRYFDALKGGVPAPGLYSRILREVEHPLIVATLEITRGNQVKAAEILGLNRNTLRKKIKTLNIRAGR